MPLLFSLVQLFTFSFSPVAAPEIDARARLVEVAPSKADLMHGPMTVCSNKSCR